MDVTAVAVAGRGLVDPREPVFAADDEALAARALRVRDRCASTAAGRSGSTSISHGSPRRPSACVCRLPTRTNAGASSTLVLGARRRDRARASPLLDRTDARRHGRPDRSGARDGARARAAARGRRLVDRRAREREVDELRREHGRAGRRDRRRRRRRAARRPRRNGARSADGERVLARGRPAADTGARAADPRRRHPRRGAGARRARDRGGRVPARPGCSTPTRCSSARRSAR